MSIKVQTEPAGRGSGQFPCLFDAHGHPEEACQQKLTGARRAKKSLPVIRVRFLSMGCNFV